MARFREQAQVQTTIQTQAPVPELVRMPAKTEA
jgi:hypothetical protein